MADLVSYMGAPAALSEGLKALFADSLTGHNLNDWRIGSGDREADNEKKRVAWYRLQEERPYADEHKWRLATQWYVDREIRRGTPSGRYLEDRRNRVLAALGMTREEALAKLTYEPKGGTA